MAAEEDHVLVLLELFFLRTGPIDAVLVVPVDALHRPQTGGEGGAGDARQHEAWRQQGRRGGALLIPKPEVKEELEEASQAALLAEYERQLTWA